MARSTKTTPAGAVTDSAPDTPPAGQPGPSAAPPGGPAAAIVAALTAAPGATAAQLAETAGIARAAAARVLAALEKAGHATRDRNGSPATWTARNVPEKAPGTDDGPEAVAWPHNSSIAPADAAPQGTEAPDAGDPDPEEDTGSAAPVDPSGIAPGAGEALGSAAAAAAQAEAALQAGDLAGALAAADHLTQAAARTQRRLRDAAGPPAAGRRLGRRPANCAAWSLRTWPPTRPRTSARTRSARS